MDASKRTVAKIAGHMIAICILAGLWELGAAHGWINFAFFGKPSGILAYLRDALFVSGKIWRELGFTLAGTFASFVLGSVAAVAVALLFVVVPPLERATEPYLALLNALPRIALAPLFLLWFGLGLGSKVAVGCSLTFFIVLSSTIAGMRSVAADHVTLSRTLGATPAQIFRKVTLPSAVPVIFSGLRLGLIYAMLGVVGAELIAAEHGLGQQLAALQSAFHINGVLAILLLLALLGLTITWVMTLIERRLLRWQ